MLPSGVLPVLRGVTLRLEPGRVLGLVGESGAGKTMVGKAVLGIAPGRARISGGTITFDAGDITHLAGEARRALLDSLGRP